MTDGAAGATIERVGEVVEASSDRFTAQCYRLYKSPHLGALVRAASNLGGGEGEQGAVTVYGVVRSVGTQSLDPTRLVVARGEDAASEEEVYRSNPQLSRLLTTHFQCLIVGHAHGSDLHQYLPPLPPGIHSFVYACQPSEVREFTDQLHFLRGLITSTAAGDGAADDVVSSCLRIASFQWDDRRAFLVRAGKAVAAQLTADLPRLNSILRRLSP